LTTLMLVY